MTTSRDPSQLHPLAIIGAVAAQSVDASPAPVDAEPDPVPDRAGVNRRLLAVLSARMSVRSRVSRTSSPTRP